MARDLCSHCGHPLPNAAGPGLYCNNCGEPVNKSEPRARTVVNPKEVTVKNISVTFEHMGGPEATPEYLLDYFAASIGKENGSKSPMVLVIPDDAGNGAHYRVKLVDG